MSAAQSYHVRDILSHPDRSDRIHILSLDGILTTDVYERIHNDPRLKRYELVRPRERSIRKATAEIESLAQGTVTSKLLIFDVRKSTLPRLKKAYNKIVGYNRRDLNRLCFSILIGDGPMSLFQAGKTMDVFVPHISAHRVDYHPAVFFYDPFLHYEPGELQLPGMHDEFVLPDRIPTRLGPYFQDDADMGVERVRRYLRAIGKDEQIRERRLRRLKKLYSKRIEQQFPHHKDKLEAWLSREGMRLASEKLHLYPLYFEDWVDDLLRKASRR